ncbi:MAG: hypothetical protein H6502_02860 [Candidatus Woesearchaeota archaeon]|nr:MAG: hypothetical protein H6502_02860 [Candidatus Woesearchaeota archaeon]
MELAEYIESEIVKFLDYEVFERTHQAQSDEYSFYVSAQEYLKMIKRNLERDELEEAKANFAKLRSRYNGMPATDPNKPHLYETLKQSYAIIKEYVSQAKQQDKFLDTFEDVEKPNGSAPVLSQPIIHIHTGEEIITADKDMINASSKTLNPPFAPGGGSVSSLQSRSLPAEPATASPSLQEPANLDAVAKQVAQLLSQKSANNENGAFNGDEQKDRPLVEKALNELLDRLEAELADKHVEQARTLYSSSHNLLKLIEADNPRRASYLQHVKMLHEELLSLIASTEPSAPQKTEMKKPTAPSVQPLTAPSSQRMSSASSSMSSAASSLGSEDRDLLKKTYRVIQDALALVNKGDYHHASNELITARYLLLDFSGPLLAKKASFDTAIRKMTAAIRAKQAGEKQQNIVDQHDASAPARSELEKLYLQGLHELRQGRAKEAKEIFETLLAQNPNFELAQRQLKNLEVS